MDEQSLLTWFEQMEGRVSQTFTPGTHQYAMRTALLTEMQTALESVFPPSHTVLRRWEDVRSRESQALQNDHGSRLEFAQDELIAIFRVAHRLLKEGHAHKFADGIRAETTMQCLDQAEALVKAGYVAAAMVLAGGALETHLQNVCGRFALSWSGDGSISKYKQALDQARNQGLQNLVTSSDSSLIESWGKDRNTAAHTPTAFTKTPAEVRLAIEGIRQFLARAE
jgi:hypothetical protein